MQDTLEFYCGRVSENDITPSNAAEVVVKVVSGERDSEDVHSAMRVLQQSSVDDQAAAVALITTKLKELGIVEASVMDGILTEYAAAVNKQVAFFVVQTKIVAIIMGGMTPEMEAFATMFSDSDAGQHTLEAFMGAVQTHLAGRNASEGDSIVPGMSASEVAEAIAAGLSAVTDVCTNASGPE